MSRQMSVHPTSKSPQTPARSLLWRKSKVAESAPFDHFVLADEGVGPTMSRRHARVDNNCPYNGRTSRPGIVV